MNEELQVEEEKDNSGPQIQVLKIEELQRSNSGSLELVGQSQRQQPKADEEN